jgi:hypothetical protein
VVLRLHLKDKIMKTILLFAMMICWLLNGTIAGAQVPAGLHWQLVKEGKGISVYSAPAPSGLKYVKVSASMTGTLETVNAVFRDISRQPNWVYATRRVHLVQRIDNQHLVYYNETGLPWPVSNREVFIRMILNEDPALHTLIIDQEAVPSTQPVPKGLVRVARLTGKWLFRDEGKGRLHADYTLFVDPGGSLPAWVVNLFVVKGPYETFVKLRDQLQVVAK